MSGPSSNAATTVVFDLGGVLIDWDPRYLYRQLLATDNEIADFLAEIDFEAWNHTMDSGQGTWAAAVEELSAAHPHRRDLIEAYPARFAETMSGPIEEPLSLVRELHEQGTSLYALTNWSAETFGAALQRFDFLARFDGIVVSGCERVAKPDPAIFEILVDRYGIDPPAAVFVDDKQVNVDAAVRAGLRGVLYTGPDQLRADLVSAGLLSSRAP